MFINYVTLCYAKVSSIAPYLKKLSFFLQLLDIFCIVSIVFNTYIFKLLKNELTIFRNRTYTYVFILTLPCFKLENIYKTLNSIK